MANDTRSTRKNKEDENSNSKGRHSSGKALTSSSTETPDTSNLRRSARETSSSTKNTTPSPSSTRKSERLEKRISTISPPVQRKSDRTEKWTAPVPLRRSERGKKPSSSSSSGSKKYEKSSSSSEIKLKKEKSVKQLTMETIEVSNRYDEEDSEPVRVIKKNMDARTFRTLFVTKKVKRKDHDKELNRNNNHKDDGSNRVNGIVKFTETRQEELREKEVAGSCDIIMEAPNVSANSSEEEKLKVPEANSPEVGDSVEFTRGDKVVTEVIVDAEHSRVDCFSKENSQSLEVVDSSLGEGTLDGVIGSERHHSVMRLKRKRNEMDAHSDASAMITDKDSCISHVEVIASSPKDWAETCGTCFKRQRINHESTRQEFCTCLLKSIENVDERLIDASIAKDRGKLEASATPEPAAECENLIQHNGALLDVPTDGYQDTCTVCKLGGELLCCNGKGCKRSYHLYCLDPPLEDVPFGAWHCILCVRKKIEAGVHSLSNGIEAIWDAREVSDGEGLRKQKQYFVKYKGLAHVHNRWLPESQILCEVPMLVEKFNQKNQVARWKQEWTLPHRLLQRRLLFSPKQYDEYVREHAHGGLDCRFEWLVKWRGLHYEDATWELENASFISPLEFQRLIRDYKNRREKAKSFSSSLSAVEKKTRKGFRVKLSQLPAGGSSGPENSLEFVNNLREYWHKGHNAVVFDDQERISKVILFILSLLSDVCRPFLVISTSDLLHVWEDEFLRLAPSADVVVYSGNKEMRKSIRTLEFYEEGGCVMFQALITSPEFLTEDLNVFESIGWEAIIIDECQLSQVSYFEQIKLLVTDMRLLLVSGRLKDTIVEYVTMLTLLDSQPHSGLPSSEGLTTGSNDNISSLKENLSKFVAYGGKSDSSRFVEFWVPVEISNVQLEQYCATLLSNSFALCSPLKNDPVGVLHDVLISSKKCCDHPYIVDQSLQSLLIKNLKESEYLDVGIKASGKLQLLDMMLSEMKNRALRVLILFQSIGGSGKDSVSIGDILDDFVRQRFGPDSYERVDGNILPAKKQAALNNFNKERGRFVFLLETRACLPSIKLSSIDTVVIFHSDWSPVNDLKALQKITLDSQSEQIKVFRLYSSFTVEERALILAKQDRNADYNVQNISKVACHVLLMWGASYLFNRLDKFHGNDSPKSSLCNFFEQSILKDVAEEFLTILTQSGGGNNGSEFNKILKVKQNQGTYYTKFLLFGESKIGVMDEGAPHLFWMKLLEGKSPCWKYSSVSSQRSRKRVQYFDNLQKKPDATNDEIVKKQKKVANNAVDPSSLKRGLQEGKRVSRDKEGPSRILAHGETISLKHACSSPSFINNIPGSPREFCYSQRSLHLHLKPEMAKLCDVLQLREDVKDMVEKFLEYFMINYHVDTEPATVLQAFQLSLCWTAASLRKQKIDHQGSLDLAKMHLNFGCKKVQVEFMYSKLQCLKKLFLCEMEKLKAAYHPKASEMSTESFGKSNLHASSTQPETPVLQKKVKVEVEDLSVGQDCFIEQDFFMVAQKDFSKSIRKIQKKFQKRMAKLLQKHQEEKADIDQKYEEQKAKLENEKRVEEVIISSQYQDNNPMKTDRLKILDNKYAQQFKELKHNRDIRRENLEAEKVAEMSNVREMEAAWMEGVKSWLQKALQHKPLSNEFGHGLQYTQTSEEVNAHDSLENFMPVSSYLSERLNPDNHVSVTPVGGVELSEDHETASDIAVACSQPIENVALAVRTSGGSDELNTIATERTRDAGSKEHPETGNFGENRENMVSMNPCSEGQISDGAMLSMPGEQIQSVVSGALKSSFPENGLKGMHLSELNYEGARLGSEGEFPERVAEAVCSSNSFENIVSVNGLSCDEVPDGATNRIPDGEVLLRVPETASSTGGLETITSVNTPLSVEQIPIGLALNVPEVQVPVGVPEIVISSDGLENVVSVTVALSGEENPRQATLCMPDTEFPLSAPETSCGEVEGGNTNGGNDVPDAISSDNTTGVDQDDREGYNVHMHELSPVNSAAVLTLTTIPQVGPIQPNLALCSEAGTSSGSRIEDAAAGDTQIPSQDVAPDGSNHRIPATGSVAQMQLPSVGVIYGRLSPDLPSITNQVAEAGTASGAPIEDAAAGDMQIPSQRVEPSISHLPNDVAPARSNNGALATGSLAQMQSPSEGVIYGRNSPDLLSVASQVAEGPIMMVENHVEPSNQAISQPSDGYAANRPILSAIDGLGTSMSDISTASAISGHGNRTVQNAPAVATRLPDPLHNELERLFKEKEKSSKIHEETKLQLKSDCDREIEEIRRKYEIKLQETEAEFRIKMEELHTNYNKVLMSKILAEAFKSKCMDLKASTAAMLQELASSFIQQLAQTSSHQTAQRPSMLAGPSSGPLTPTLQATSTPAISLPNTSSPAARPRTGVPPLQAVHHSPALFSSAPTRPPHIGSMISPPANHQFGSGIRAPAPHLQPFRPSMSISSTALQQMPVNPAATSLSLAQTPHRPATPPPPPPTSHSGTYNRVHRPDTGGGVPSLANSSLSALDLLMDLDNRSSANSIPPSSLPPPSNPSLSFGKSVQPESSLAGSMGGSPGQITGATDIVCLSDDD